VTTGASGLGGFGPPSGAARHRRRRLLDGWTAATLAVAAAVALPLLALFWLAFTPTTDIWRHLAATVLPHYALTTALLCLGVAGGTVLLGVAGAWLVTMFRFPGRGIFEWALLLPLAMPAYVVAFVYTDLLEFAGPVQGALRALFGWTSARDYWFPPIRSLGGAILMLSLVLYPYVYLLARSAFVEQCVTVLEVSRVLGRGAWSTFLFVALRLARPAIVVGVILALMETLNDYGTVQFFAVQTFTVGIVDVWLHMGNPAGAAQLALVLLAVVILLIWGERLARGGRRFDHAGTSWREIQPPRLTGLRAAAAFAVCGLPVLLGFVLPAGVLAWYAVTTVPTDGFRTFFAHAANSLFLAGVAATAAVLLGLVMAYGGRLGGGPVLRAGMRFASLGYAVPGAVLAIGVLIPLAAFDNAVDAFMRARFGISTGLLLSGTIFAVSFALVVRFLALAYGTLESGLSRITPNMDDAARMLGHGPLSRLVHVHVPIMWGSVLTGGLLVFVDCMKELPMTLILRPFNFDTLATSVFQFASEERLEKSSLAALAIVLAGILPVVILSRVIGRARPGQRGG